jgi:hypothetical protein
MCGMDGCKKEKGCVKGGGGGSVSFLLKFEYTHSNMNSSEYCSYRRHVYDTVEHFNFV